MNFSGMDPDAVDGIAGSLAAQAAAIDGVIALVDSVTTALGSLWFGDNFGAFHGGWHNSQKPQALAASSDIGGVVTFLRAQAAQQRTASDMTQATGIGGWGGVIAWGKPIPWNPIGWGGPIRWGGPDPIGQPIDWHRVLWGAPIALAPWYGLLATRPDAAGRGITSVYEGLHQDTDMSGSAWTNAESLLKAEESLGHDSALKPYDYAMQVVDNVDAFGSFANGHPHWTDAVHAVAGDVGDIPAVSHSPVGFLAVTAVNAWDDVITEATKVDWSPRATAMTFSYMASHPMDDLESFGDAVVKTADQAVSWLPHLF